MTHACNTVRSEILGGGPPTVRRSAHLDVCGPCRAFETHLTVVDRALAEDAVAAATPLPAALRARILRRAASDVRATASSARRDPPRAKIFDIALRASAVAAVFTAAAWITPGAAQAGEMKIGPLSALTSPFDGAAVDIALLPDVGALRWLDATTGLDVGGLGLPLAGAAIALLALGLLLRRR